MHDNVNMDSVKEYEDINAEIQEALDALTEQDLTSWKKEEQEYTEADHDITCSVDGEHNAAVKEVRLQKKTKKQRTSFNRLKK